MGKGGEHRKVGLECNRKISKLISKQLAETRSLFISTCNTCKCLEHGCK